MPRISASALTGLCLVCLGRLCFPQVGASEWRGRRQLVVFDFGTATQNVGKAHPETFKLGLLTEFDYDIYQNDRGVVRYVLTRRSGSRKDSPGDFGNLLIDHPNGLVFVLDSPGGAFRSKLVRPGSTITELENRKILGYDCRGVQISYEDPNHFKHVRRMWVPRDASFKDPLLEIAYIFDPDGSLGELSVGAVTRLEKASSLDPTLFQLPAGAKPVEAK
jgi:hypothetical protein